MIKENCKFFKLIPGHAGKTPVKFARCSNPHNVGYFKPCTEELCPIGIKENMINVT